MPSLDDILTGFDSVRAEGSAFVVEASTTTAFTLVDAVQLMALHRYDGQALIEPKTYAIGDRSTGAFFVLWARKDGTFGAMAPLSLPSEPKSIRLDGTGLQLFLRGYHDGTRPAMAFAVAADPYVATDFCRVASARAMSESPTPEQSLGERIDVPLDKIDPRDAIFAAAIASLWSRSVTLGNPSSGESISDSEKLFTDVARALFQRSPAMATRDRIFVDCQNEARVLKVFAHKGRDGVLGIFNCERHGELPITDTWRVDDVEGLGGEQFAAWHAIERKLIIIDRGVDETIDMPLFGAELIHLVPILQNVAPLGLINNLNSTASLTRVGSRKCRLANGGTVGWYAGVKPSRVTLNGESVSFDYQQASGLVSFQAETGRLHDSEVFL